MEYTMIKRVTYKMPHIKRYKNGIEVRRNNVKLCLLEMDKFPDSFHLHAIRVDKETAQKIKKKRPKSSLQQHRGVLVESNVRYSKRAIEDITIAYLAMLDDKERMRVLKTALNEEFDETRLFSNAVEFEFKGKES